MHMQYLAGIQAELTHNSQRLSSKCLIELKQINVVYLPTSPEQLERGIDHQHLPKVQGEMLGHHYCTKLLMHNV